ncbi:MAG: endonuclease [Limnohabitans sp.]|nr:endonuclease [Limnohabitans sp.]
MRIRITTLLLFIFNLTFAQCPTNLTTYYSSATGTGATLKTQLYNIIKGHTDQGYNGLYTTYTTSDIDHFYENDGSIMDMYSERPTAADPYNFSSGSTQRCGNYSAEGDCYNREHIIPQSVFSSNTPMVSDAHFIPPTDGKVNGMRSNYPHGNVATATWTSLNGGKLGTSAIPGYSGTVFEPINEFKGDIARMYFYFVTRYENTVAGYSYGAFSGNNYPAIDSAFLSMLITWHNNDPVSTFEIARNNAICTRQGNRNPYIDHPEWVASVWGSGGCGTDTQAPTTPTNLTVGTITSTTISLSWNASTDNVAVTNYDIYVDGVKYASSGGTTSITINGLNPSTTYAIYVVAKDCPGNNSIASTTINATTSAGTGGSCSGTSTLENFENIPAASSTYTTNTWTNAATSISWTATDSRTDQTLTTKSITIKNGALTSATGNITTGIGELTVTTQQKFSTGAAGTFKLKVNGNIIGDIPFNAAGGTPLTTTLQVNVSGNAVISIDTNSNGTASRVAFDDLTWTCYDNTLATTTLINENSFKIFPNPSNGNFKIEFSELNEDYSIEVLTSLGQRVFEKINLNNREVNINNLSKGIYLVKITKDSNTVFKKVIVE